jgi:predicted aldo/keto reductase-like oxidoreductase
LDVIYRKLGRSGIDVGVVGLGAEYLEKAPRELIVSIVDEMVEHGANYVDLFMASPGVRDNFGFALKGRREKVMVAGHLGATMKNDQYSRSRRLDLCQQFFDDLLTRLQTDYIDILMLHFIDEEEDLDRVFAPDGVLDLARRLQREGKARLIGMSSHSVPVSLKAVNSGSIDVLMFPVNPAVDTLPGDVPVDSIWTEAAYRPKGAPEPAAGRRELYHACATQGAAIAAMKPYSAGWLFNKDNPSGIVLTPVQCLSYALSQPGVATVLPGCSSVDHLKQALEYLTATDEQKDYSAIDVNEVWKLRGSCMYCNHCLPCPVHIDIGATTRLADTAGYQMAKGLAGEYEAMPVPASACTECGVCVDRCPFEVDVIANMKRAEAVFGK